MTDPLREKLAAWNFENRYPEKLAEQFPRILNRIVELWGTPGMQAYFDDLLIMDRHDRQGFPPDIGAELMSVAFAHDQIMNQQETATHDIWEHVREEVESQLRELGFQATPRDFQRAITQGNTAAVLLFIGAGVEVNGIDDVGWTPLIRACFEGNSEMALVLIKHGADIHVRDRDGYSPLHWASLNGHEEVIQLLLDRSVNVNSESNQGFTPLIQAASCGHERVVRQLIGAGAIINTSTKEGWTALHKAVANGHLQTSVALLDLGADATARHMDGTTPLSLALNSGNKALAGLLNLGASLQARQRQRQRG
ncbi:MULTISPECIES: ankyrin repeat domain-containing protein [Silvimonas]|uniref:ankyrin repeat domain-containing protein n=1 Tax=Silvimonas TaxID=300264 RepID=UPI0024B37E3D|nr:MULTISPECIES: ankyrin repeat domain-containing protein [Silvimonas]MDR3426812.1 ankyrin repeat domain-containing protein [Silvimonas sp.]